MSYDVDYFLDFVDKNPLSRREANAVYEFAKALEEFHGDCTTAEIMDIIVQYYE